MGFSDPDPAAVERDDGLVVEGGSILDVLDDTVSCTNCAHYSVCGIIAGIRPMLENWRAGDEGDEAPIDPVTLAVICQQFLPVEEPG